MWCVVSAQVRESASQPVGFISHQTRKPSELTEQNLCVRCGQVCQSFNQFPTNSQIWAGPPLPAHMARSYVPVCAYLAVSLHCLSSLSLSRSQQQQQMPWSPTDLCCSVSFAVSLHCLSTLRSFSILTVLAQPRDPRARTYSDLFPKDTLPVTTAAGDCPALHRVR